MGYLKESWRKWHHIHQERDRSIQEYTTKFWQQVVALEISLDDYSTMMKYTIGLHAQINNELSFFKTYYNTTMSLMLMTIEKKN